MQKHRLYLYLFALSVALPLFSQIPTTPVSSSSRRTQGSAVIDTALTAQAVRDSIHAREREISDAYDALMGGSSAVSDELRLALRTDVYCYTDSHLPEEVNERAELEAREYADSLRLLAIRGDYDEIIAIASKKLKAKYDSLLIKKCGKAYVMAGDFDPHASNLDKYQRKVVKMKNQLLPDLRAELRAEQEITLPDLQAVFRAQRISDLRRDPMVYPAFKDAMVSLHEQVDIWCSQSDSILASNYIERIVNPWFNENFEFYTLRRGPLHVNKVMREVRPVTIPTIDNRTYAAGAAVTQASYPGGNVALNFDIEQRIRKPASVRSGRVSGTVVVRVVIEKTGEVGDAKIQQSLNSECDAEAIRLIHSLPRRFNPAKNARGEAVMQYVDIKVNFKK